MNPYKLLPVPFGKKYKEASVSNLKLHGGDTKKIYDWIVKASGFFLFLGVPGCGKTHTSAAIYNWIVDNTNHGIRYIFWHDLRAQIQEGFKNGGSEDEILRKFTDVKYLILDDIGSDLNSDWQVRMLFSLLDKRCINNLPTFVTSNLNEAQIREGLGARIHSRIFDFNSERIEDWSNDYRRSEA